MSVSKELYIVTKTPKYDPSLKLAIIFDKRTPLWENSYRKMFQDGTIGTSFANILENAFEKLKGRDTNLPQGGDTSKFSAQVKDAFSKATLENDIMYVPASAMAPDVWLFISKILLQMSKLDPSQGVINSIGVVKPESKELSTTNNQNTTAAEGSNTKLYLGLAIGAVIGGVSVKILSKK